MRSRPIPPRQKYLLCTVGLFLTIGVSLLLYWPWLFRNIIELGMAMKPNSKAYHLWKVNPMPIYLDFYVFNWTNPHDIHNASIKPKFVEIGPFRFRETKKKVNVTWNTNNTVSFYHKKTWLFDRTLSVGDLDMNITSINPVSVSGAFQVRNWNFWLKKGFQFSLGQFAPKLPITKTVGEFIFFGYKDVFVSISNAIPMPGLPSMDRFGWFYGRNNSMEAEGFFNMDTTPKNSGQLRRWNTSNTTKAYSDSCANIGGSAGEFYKKEPGRTNVTFFSSDLCRIVALDYEKDVLVKGFEGYKFSAGNSFLDNGTIKPENACYCNGDCIPYGMLNVSTCKFGAPGFVSLPHFYKADPYYLNMVEGLKPNRSVHDFFLVLEPRTGVPLSVAARLQLNLLVQPVRYVTLFENIPKVFFPVLWFEQVVDIPEELQLPFRMLLSVPLICQILGYIFVGISISVITYILYEPIVFILNSASPHAKKLKAIEAVPLNQSCKEQSTEVDIKREKLLLYNEEEK